MNHEILADTIQGKQEDIDYAVESAKAAQVKWAALKPHVRARHLYAIARAVQKHARLIAVVEALDNGKPIRETRDADLVARHFYHHAGWAQLSGPSPLECPVNVVNVESGDRIGNGQHNRCQAGDVYAIVGAVTGRDLCRGRPAKGCI